jgi:hypothetical protein
LVHTLDQLRKDGGTVYDNSESHNIYNIVEISSETLRYIHLFAMAGSIYLRHVPIPKPTQNFWVLGFGFGIWVLIRLSNYDKDCYKKIPLSDS